MLSRWLFVLVGLIALAAAVAYVAFLFATGSSSDASNGAAFLSNAVQALLTFASLGAGAFVWVTRVQPAGILWWNRLWTRRLSVSARVTVTFMPDDTPRTDELDRRLRDWNDSRLFEVIGSESGQGGTLQRLDVQAARLGRVVLQVLSDSPERAAGEDEALAVVLTLPSMRQDLRHLVLLIETELDPLIHALAPVLGDSTGIQLDAELDPNKNPFYGVYMRDDISRAGVTMFNVHLRPRGTSEVEIGQEAITIRARSRPDFISVAGAMLNLRPVA